MSEAASEPCGTSQSSVYQAVFFDLFGTLVSQVEHCYARISALLGVPQAELLRRWQEDAAGRYLGHLTFGASLTNVARALCPSLDGSITDLAIRMGLDDLAVSPGSVSPVTLNVLERLSRACVPVGLVSNNWVEVLDFWPHSELARYFPSVVFSSVVGVAKPDAAIYQLAHQPLGLKPEDCLYVGDGGDHELEGAAAIGMTPVQVTHRLRPVAAAKFHFDSLDRVLDLLDLSDEPLASR